MATINNLDKAYKQYPTRWSRLMEWLVPISKPCHQLKWVERPTRWVEEEAQP